MTLQQLRYIVTIVNCGSISDAAKQLFITQPSLSNAVKELEKEMGISIFNRSSKGIALSSQGMEFLSYARQVLEQAELLEQHYTNKKPVKRICSISTQHYAFAVNAFANLVSRQSTDEYEFTLRETRTYEIIDDVKNYRSELGILYINDFNRKVLEKLFKESGLVFHPLFRASPHVFISVSHPLSARKRVTIEDLEDYPFLAFEQGEKKLLLLLRGNTQHHTQKKSNLCQRQGHPVQSSHRIKRIYHMQRHFKPQPERRLHHGGSSGNRG